MTRIAIGWEASSFFGWGVYGMNLALEWAKDPSVEAMSTLVCRVDRLALDRLRLSTLRPFLERTNGAGQIDGVKGSVRLQALGNQLTTTPEERARIGVAFFEEPLSPQAVERGKSYDILVAGSTWNADTLKGHGLTNVRTMIQGVDRSVFHRALRRGLYPGRFLIFSGGKAEERKGQDIVVKAFRIFAERHPEAMLVTAWHSPWPEYRRGLNVDLSGFHDRVIDVGEIANSHMAGVYRECHVGLFTNRREGGTNLVAMEAMACGLPCIVSHNTGHMDLFDMTDAYPIKSMQPTAEPDVDEILDLLERAFSSGLCQERDTMPGWGVTATGLLEAVRGLS